MDLDKRVRRGVSQSVKIKFCRRILQNKGSLHLVGGVRLGWVWSGHLGKLGPGGKVIILLHSDEGHIGVTLCVWQERVFTGVLAVVQNLSFTAGGGGRKPKTGPTSWECHTRPCA